MLESKGVVKIKIIKTHTRKLSFNEISRGLFRKIIQGYDMRNLIDQIEFDLLEEQLNVIIK